MAFEGNTLQAQRDFCFFTSTSPSWFPERLFCHVWLRHGDVQTCSLLVAVLVSMLNSSKEALAWRPALATPGDGGTHAQCVLLLAGDVQTKILKISQQTAEKLFDSSRFFRGGRYFEQ